MWDEIYLWMEAQSGVSYDLSDDIKEVSGDAIFVTPHQWKTNVRYILNKLSEAIDVIDENYKNLHEDLPNRDQMKKMFTAQVLGNLVKIINSIKQKLCIEQTDITNVETLQDNIDALYDIVEELRTESIENIMSSDWYDDYNEENDNVLSVKMSIHKNDLPNMHFSVQSIVDLHEDYEE